MVCSLRGGKGKWLGTFVTLHHDPDAGADALVDELCGRVPVNQSAKPREVKLGGLTYLAVEVEKPWCLCCVGVSSS